MFILIFEESCFSLFLSLKKLVLSIDLKIVGNSCFIFILSIDLEIVSLSLY